VPRGIDLSTFRPMAERAWPPSPLRLITLKVFRDLTRIDLILQAAALLKKANVSFQWRLFGEGPLLQEMKNLNQCLQLQNHVSLHPFMDTASVVKELNQAHVFVSANSSDGPSIALMEAMACATVPVIADLPSYLENVESMKNGLIFSGGSANTLADTLHHFIKLPLETYRQLQNAAVQTAKNRFNWDHNFLQLRDRFQQLIQR